MNSTDIPTRPTIVARTIAICAVCRYPDGTVKHEPINDETYTIKQAAKIVGKSRSRIKQLLAEGILEGYQVGARWHIYGPSLLDICRTQFHAHASA